MMLCLRIGTKIVSKEEDEAHSRAVLEGGLKTAGITLVGTLVLAGALQKARWQPFTQLTVWNLF